MLARGGSVQLESGIACLCAWAALSGAFVLSWQTWVGIGGIAEYGDVRYALPVCVDGYIVTVLMAWIMPVSDKAQQFARWNVFLSSGLSIATQSIYHGALVYSDTEASWKALIAWVAGAMPPLFAALSVHFRMAVRSRSQSQMTESPLATESTRGLSMPSTPTPANFPESTSLPPPVHQLTSPRSVPEAPHRERRERRVMPTRASRVKVARKSQTQVDAETAARKAYVWRALDADPNVSLVKLASDLGVTDRTIRNYRTEWESTRTGKGVAS